jgi:hypothetical protein
MITMICKEEGKLVQPLIFINRMDVLRASSNNLSCFWGMVLFLRSKLKFCRVYLMQKVLPKPRFFSLNDTKSENRKNY